MTKGTERDCSAPQLVLSVSNEAPEHLNLEELKLLSHHPAYHPENSCILCHIVEPCPGKERESDIDSDHQAEDREHTEDAGRQARAGWRGAYRSSLGWMGHQCLKQGNELTC